MGSAVGRSYPLLGYNSTCVARAWTSMMHGKWCPCDTMLAQLAEPLKCGALARGTFLQDTPAVVCQRHPRWDDGGATQAGRD
jgi:hypothetical protein